MLDYATAAAARAHGGKDEGQAVAEALVSGERWCPLVKRPDGGLRAGLWEFPGTGMPCP